MGRKGVAQDVRRNARGVAFQIGADAFANHFGENGAAQRFAAWRKKERGLEAFKIGGALLRLFEFVNKLPTPREITLQCLCGGFAKGHDAFAIALAKDAEMVAFKVDVVQREANQFGASQATSIE